jgi:hypothetical protein
LYIYISQSLEDQLRARDNASVGTNSAVKNLEVHHVASLTDLRGRIVRCDTSISKLSQELRNCSDSIKQVNGQQQDNQNRLLDRIHNLESKVIFFCKLKSLFHYPLANEVAKGYSNATFRLSVLTSVRHIFVNTLGSTSFNGFWPNLVHI